MSENSKCRATALMVVAASLALSGCSGMSERSLGGRPFLYKQGPADTQAAEPAADAAPVPPAAAAPAAPVAPVAPMAATAPATTAPVVAAPKPAAPTPTAAATDAGEFLNRYTQATRYGDLLFISGQIAVDPETGAFDDSRKIEPQAAQALDNVRLILEANRLTLANVVFVTVYLKNISDLATLDRVYHNLFKATPPARSVLQVANLPRGALIEISAVAGK